MVRECRRSERKEGKQRMLGVREGRRRRCGGGSGGGRGRGRGRGRGWTERG